MHQFYWLRCKSDDVFEVTIKKLPESKLKSVYFSPLLDMLHDIVLGPRNRQLGCYKSIQFTMVQIGYYKFPKREGCKYSINQVQYAEYQSWNYITFHCGFPFFQIRENGQNQICLDTNTNIYLVAKYTRVVFSLYTVGSFKIQV